MAPIHAMITGASRGIGRGIAYALAETKATLFLTGRTLADLDETAQEVTRRGGRAVPIRCDHGDDAQVEAAFERVRSLDLLVNNAWGGYENHSEGIGMEHFWKTPVVHWEGMFTRGLRAQFVAARLAAPLLMAHPRSLIVNTIAWAGGKYLHHLYYDVVKTASARMAYDMALELAPHGVACVALAPGFARTEAVLAAHAAQPFDLKGTESVEYAGRAVVHLMNDPGLLALSGQVVTAGGLARRYGFTDVDGRQPEAFVMPPAIALD